MLHHLRTDRLCLIFLLGAMLVAGGCAQAEPDARADEPAKTPNAQATDQPQPAAKAQEKQPEDKQSVEKPADATEGAASAARYILLDAIKKLEQQKPPATTMDQLIPWVKKTRPEIVAAADRALAAELTDDQRKQVLQSKWRALALLTRVETPGAAQAFRAFTEQLAKDADPDLARQAREQLFGLRAMELVEDPTKDPQSLMADLQAYLADGAPNEAKFGLVQNVAQLLEVADRPEQALQLYNDLAEAFKPLAEKEPDLAKASAQLQDFAQRRLTLVGKPVEIEGNLLDGSTFDWSKYQGKVVLLDFWATWCPACIEELPNVQKYHELYRDRGFEVVGITLDDDKEAVEQFYEERKLPWPTLFGVDAEGNQPIAARYGISSIPVAMLVGKDGKVISLAARGEGLGRHLEKLLGTVTQ